MSSHKFQMKLGSGSTAPTATPDPTQKPAKDSSIYAELPSVAQPFEIDSVDVIKVVEQFLQEQGLYQSLRALQNETGITHNCVPDVDGFIADIHDGRWDRVLETTGSLSLPAELAADLLEHVCLELCELKEHDTARAIMTTSPAIRFLAERLPERYTRLDRLCVAGAVFDPAVYRSPRAARRQAIAAAVRKQICAAPPSRLVTLLGQALRWQRHTGAGVARARDGDYDVFLDAGHAGTLAHADEAWVTQPLRSVRMGSGSHAEAAALVPGAEWVVTGSSDGFVEVWSTRTGKLAAELEYQAREQFMLHAQGVSALAVSADGEVCVSASVKGELKAWALATGECVRRVAEAHPGCVNALALSSDGLRVLSGGEDGTARVHGLRGGQLVLEARGHAGPVRAVAWPACGMIVTGGADGEVRVWDESGVVVGVLAVGNGVTGMVCVPGRPDAVIVASGSDHVDIVDVRTAKVLQTLTVTVQPNTPVPQLNHVAASKSGKFVYAMGSDGVLYVFRAETGRIAHALRPHGQEVFGITHHPTSNMLATYSRDGTLRLWSS